MLLIERIPAASSFARNQSGLGPTLTFSIRRSGIERALVRRAEFAIAAVRGLASASAIRGGLQRFSGERGDLARETEMAQQIAAVRRDLDIENRVRPKERSERLADFRVGRKNQKSVAIFGQFEFARDCKAFPAIRRRAVC